MAEADHRTRSAQARETIEGLFLGLEAPLLRYAVRLTKDMALAEDIVQEAFLKLHHQFEAVRQPQRWLYRTVHNLALNQQRDSGKIVPLPQADWQTEVEPPDQTDPQPLPDEEIARSERLGQVRLGLEALDERSRRLLHLKFHEDLSYKEISERTGLTPGHVGYLLHHALKALAAELTRGGLIP